MRRRCSFMTHASDAAPGTIAAEEDAVVGGAWLGPAIGSGILTVLWAIYLVEVVIGIFSATPG
jgi:hypothetical protein